MDPAAQSMHITVIIVTHQSAATLGTCLRPLSGMPDVAVQVVDNASTDATREIAVRHGVRLLPLDTNRGFAAAANVGAAGVDAGLLCFLNPDCLLSDEAVAAARRALPEGFAGCGVPAFDQRGTVVAGRQPGYTWRKVLADVMEDNRRFPGVGRRMRGHPRHHDHRWHWPLGACVFVPAAFFALMGGFDERYFLYMEDVEFGLKVHRHGGSVVGLPVTLRHGGMEGSDISSDRRRRLLNGARIQFARRHYGPLVAACAGILARP